jgi:hypothetical protein
VVHEDTVQFPEERYDIVSQHGALIVNWRAIWYFKKITVGSTNTEHNKQQPFDSSGYCLLWELESLWTSLRVMMISESTMVDNRA